MKTKNQTEQPVLELAVSKAANDDAVAQQGSRGMSGSGHKQAWSPFEVWRTRVKPHASYDRGEPSPL